jgi:hypothetical protein
MASLILFISNSRVSLELFSFNINLSSGI